MRSYYVVVLLAVRMLEGDAKMSRIELMECVWNDVELRVCDGESVRLCAFMFDESKNVKLPVQNGVITSAFAGWPIQQIKQYQFYKWTLNEINLIIGGRLHRFIGYSETRDVFSFNF